MTYVRIGGSSFSNEDIFAFVVVILVIGIASWIGYFILKSKDNSKPLEKAKVKILEKPVQKGNIEWYVVEFENGERKKLRSFHADTIFIAVGDEGILEYRGITIQLESHSYTLYLYLEKTHVPFPSEFLSILYNVVYLPHLFFSVQEPMNRLPKM